MKKLGLILNENLILKVEYTINDFSGEGVPHKKTVNKVKNSECCFSRAILPNVFNAFQIFRKSWLVKVLLLKEQEPPKTVLSTVFGRIDALDKKIKYTETICMPAQLEISRPHLVNF